MDSSLAWILRSSASCWSLRREISVRAFSSARESTCSAAAAVAASAAVARSFAAATSASAAWTLAFNSAIMASEASALARTVASSSLASVASLESAAFSAVSSLRRLSAALSFLADVSRALASCSLVAPASAAPALPLCALWGSWMVGSGWLDQRVKGEMLNLLFLNRRTAAPRGVIDDPQGGFGNEADIGGVPWRLYVRSGRDRRLSRLRTNGTRVRSILQIFASRSAPVSSSCQLVPFRLSTLHSCRRRP